MLSAIKGILKRNILMLFATVGMLKKNNGSLINPILIPIYRCKLSNNIFLHSLIISAKIHR
jgi:hypothetical protein